MDANILWSANEACLLQDAWNISQRCRSGTPLPVAWATSQTKRRGSGSIGARAQLEVPCSVTLPNLRDWALHYVSSLPTAGCRPCLNEHHLVSSGAGTLGSWKFQGIALKEHGSQH